MEYLILVIVGLIGGFFAKNWIRDALITEGVHKDSQLAKEQTNKESEIKDIKKSIEETKKTEEGRTPDQVEEYWNKK